MKTIIKLTVVAMLCLYFSSVAFAKVGDKEIKNYLKRHPEVIMDILRQNSQELITILEVGYKDKIRLENEQKVEMQIASPLSPAIEGRATFGSQKAKFTIVEYTDMMCTYCVEGDAILSELIHKYPKKIRVVIKHKTTGTIGRMEAAMYEALAEESLSLAWEFKKAAFKHRQKILATNGTYLDTILEDLKVDIPKMKKRAMNSDIQDLINEDIAEAMKFGVSGTPTFLINGVMISGAQPLSQFEKVMNKWTEFHGEDPFCDECNE